ncbi:MAG: NTP transferase domain-containing protein [Bacteroidales bacterium]|nr:NTP transferase domain-containing protein [Bacteroidales bacterium]
MRIIIPMAGMGKRMRPHTLTTPKPLLRLAGRPIVEHLIDEIVTTVKEPIEEIAFVVGDFGEQAERELLECARKRGAQGRIYYQEEPLGTAHAVLCAANSLKGPVIVGFADTIFFSNFVIKPNQEAVIWTKKVEHPEAFGVVLTDDEGRITGFAEKPKTFVSDQAIIGIYYFKDGKNLHKELRYLIDNEISKGGEYQLTDALENMRRKGLIFYSETVDEWLDCGNKAATVDTHTRLLEHKHIHQIALTAQITDSVIIPPCYIGDKACIRESVIGPCVSVGARDDISQSRISHSIIQADTRIASKVMTGSMIGREANIAGLPQSLNLGDYSQLSEGEDDV